MYCSRTGGWDKNNTFSFLTRAKNSGGEGEARADGVVKNLI